MLNLTHNKRNANTSIPFFSSDWQKFESFMTHSTGGAVRLHALLVEAELGTNPKEGKLATFIQFVSLTQQFHFWESIYRYIYVSMKILHRVIFYNTVSNSKEWKQSKYPSVVDWLNGNIHNGILCSHKK